MVKSRYRPLRGTGRGAATRALKTYLDYIAHRPDLQGERAFREVFTAADEFGTSGGRQVKHDLHRQVEGARETYGYQLVLSPGHDLNEAQIRAWARAVLAEAGLERYLAVAHAGPAAHTSHPHVHVIAFTDERLSREALLGMRVVGDAACEQTLRTVPQLRDLTPEHVEVAPAQGRDGGREVEAESGSGRSQKPVEMDTLDFE